MKRSFLLCLSAVFLISGPVSAQIKDSLGNECLIPAAESSFSQYVDRRTSTKGYRMTFVAVPLILGEGAGAEVRGVTGITVFAGMLGVTLFGLFLTPVFYVTLRKFVTRGKAEREVLPA